MKSRISTQPSGLVWKNPWQKGFTSSIWLAFVLVNSFVYQAAAQQLGVTIQYTAPACAGYNSGLATAQVSGGTGPYNFYWSNGWTGQTISNPAAGALSVTVTDAAYHSASNTTTVTIPDAVQINISGPSNPCVPGSNYLTATASGGKPPYNIVWSNGTTGQTLSGLTHAGHYFATVTDANGCVKVGGANYSPPVSASLQLYPSKCGGTCDGSIEAKVSGGVPPYSFSWDYGPTPNKQQQAPAPEGNYTVTITDGSGCTSTASGFLDDPDPISVNLAYSNPCAYPSNVTATATGGTAPYTYQWGFGQGGSTAYGLQSGTWLMIVTDAHGCAKEAWVPVSQSDLKVTAAATDSGCENQGGGTASVNVSGGSGNYTYSWSNGATGAALSNLSAGQYTVTVNDGTGCYKTATVGVQDASSFSAQAQTAAYRCDAAGGQASVTVSGTAADYSYAWSDPAKQTTPTASNLAPGQYEVTVTSADGCSKIIPVEIADASMQVTALTQAATCNENGSAQLSVTNHAGSITYQWSNGNTSNSLSGAPSGTYTVTVSDVNGCTKSLEVQLDNKEIELAMNLSKPTCINTTDGSALVSIENGGTAPFTFKWSNGASDSQLTGLSVGSYSVTVTDASGCQAVQSFAMEPQQEVAADFAWAAMNCNDEGVMVQFNGQSANAANWLWTLENGQTSTLQNPQMLVNQSPTTVQLKVTSLLGCEATTSLSIEAAPISLALQPAFTACQDEELKLELAVINPSGEALTYHWAPASLVISGQGTSQPIFAASAAGQYNVSVEVSNGTCTVHDETLVNVTDLITMNPAAFSHNQCHDLEVNFNNTSGTNGTWYFEYPNQTFLSNEQSPAFTYNAPGTYNVSFKPDGQCTAPVYLVVSVSEAPIVGFETSAANCENPVAVTFTNTSNVPVQEYHWDFGPLGTSTDANPVLSVSGSQVVKAQLTATYGDGCQQTVVSEIPVQVFAPPVLASQVSACGSNEVVALNPGGDPTYTYLWSGPNLDNPNAVNPLVTIDATSTYNVVITAQNGCSATQSIQVALPSEALTIAPLDNIIACDNAPVTLTAHANQPNISFTWSTDNDFDFTIGTDQSLTVFSGTQPITYYVMGTNPNGCTAMTSLTVQNAAVDVDFDDAFEVCKGDHLDLKVDLDGITADDFTNWFPFNPLTAPLYKNQTFNFEVTNGFGCTGSGELTVKVVEFTDSLDIIAEPAEVWAGQSTQLTVTENPGYDYSWSPLLGLSDPFGPNPVVTPEGTTTYLVEVTDLATGCRTQKKIEVKVKDIICDEPYIFIPNVFTPNGDGVNDMLKVEGFNIDELYLAIYDRWGEKVFETSSKEEGWDGAFRGTTVSGDVYGFYLKVSCPGGREFFKKGNITVLR